MTIKAKKYSFLARTCAVSDPVCNFKMNKSQVCTCRIVLIIKDDSSTRSPHQRNR